jgi:hypothetical protein
VGDSGEIMLFEGEGAKRQFPCVISSQAVPLVLLVYLSPSGGKALGSGLRYDQMKGDEQWFIALGRNIHTKITSAGSGRNLDIKKRKGYLRPRLTAVGIRCADHATPCTLKGRH